MYTIWGRPNCVWCEEAKKLLTRYFIDYNYIELDASNMEKFREVTNGARTVPQVFTKDGTHVGTYDDLVRWLKG